MLLYILRIVCLNEELNNQISEHKADNCVVMSGIQSYLKAFRSDSKRQSFSMLIGIGLTSYQQ